MLRKIAVLFVLVFVLFITLVKKEARAAAFTLQSIGTSTVGGKSITSWSYAGLRPTFRGTTDPSGAVTVTIDGSSLQVYADSSGNWVFTPTSDLTAANHNVSITNGTTTISFTLSLTTSGSLPRTGGILPTIITTVFGGLMITTGKVFFLKQR